MLALPTFWSRWRGCVVDETHPETDSILRKIQELQPEAFQVISCAHKEDWQLTNVDDSNSAFGEWVRIDDHDPHLSNCAESSLSHRGPIDDLAADTGAVISRELDLYFVEKRKRVTSKLWLSSSEGARAVVARSLRRFVASMRNRKVDKVSLNSWCVFLRVTLQERVFSKSNWFWTSNFERTLGACSALLERLHGMYETDLTPSVRAQIACTLTFEELRCAVEARIEAMKWKSRPVTALPCHTSLRRLERQLVKAEGVVPGVARLVWAQRKVMGLVQAMAYLDLISQIATDASDYHSGYIDEWTLTEQIAGASTAFAAFAVAEQWASSFRLAAGPFKLTASYLTQSVLLDVCAQMLEDCASKGLVSINDHLLKMFSEHIQGGRSVRGLRCAYASLGLNPDGYLDYSLEQIELQIDWMLSQQGNPLKLWSAYEYIRTHQRPELRDPWEPGTTNQESESNATLSEPLNKAEALKILGLDSDIVYDDATIRRQFLQLCLVHHPDKATGDHSSYLQLRAAYDCVYGQ